MRTCRPVAVLVAMVALTACGSPDPVAVRPAAGSAAPPVTVPSSTPSARASRTAPRVTAAPPAPPRVAASRPPAPMTPPPPPVSPPPKPRVRPAEIALPTHDGTTPLALMGAHTVVGSRALGCVWVVQGGTRHAAIWPPGFRARFDPVRIYDAQHREVWREGQAIELGGGGGNAAPVPGRCRTGDSALWLTAGSFATE